MKKLLFTISMMAAFSANAQSVIEPEYIGQVAVVNTDSTTTLLQKETASMKANSSKFGFIPLPGSSLLDKSKVNLVVKGAESRTTLQKGRLTFIVRAEKNDIEPSSVFRIFQFEVKKKNRQFQMAESSLLGGTKSEMSLNNVSYEVKKYGSTSYLVVIDNAEPGEYGVITTDISKIATFGVK